MKVTSAALEQPKRNLCHALRKWWTQNWFGLVLVTPAALMILGSILYPLMYAVRLSFFRFNPLRPWQRMKFIGFANYVNAFTNPDFLHSVWITFLLLIISIPIQICLGMMVALLLHQEPRGRGFFQSVYLVPMMVTPVLVGLVWSYLLDSEVGIANYFFDVLGFGHISWLANPRTALLSIVMADVWEWTPFAVLSFVAGLAALPSDPHEAALVDGATPLQRFWHVTLPLLRPVVLIVVLIRTIDAYRIFGLVLVMTNGGPGRVTEVASMLVYKTGFKFWDMGLASALAVIMLVIITLVAYGFVALIPEFREGVR